MRKNGFEAPLEPLQVLTWILLLLIVGGFYSLIIPGLSAPWSIIAGVVYGVMALSTVAAGVIACLKDPIDPNVRRFHQGQTAAGSAADKTFCFLCQLHVNKGSRHCRYCDKCVDRFDHHCKWLNNCIGRSNYRFFVALLLSTFFMTSIQLGLSAWFVVKFHSSGNQEFSDRVEEEYGRLGTTGHIVLVYIFSALVLPFLGLLAQLLGFHVMLSPRGHPNRSTAIARTLNAPDPERGRKGPAPPPVQSESTASTGDRLSAADGMVHQCSGGFFAHPWRTPRQTIHFQSRLHQDLTTYDYIVQEQRKERERREQRRKLEKARRKRKRASRG